MSKLALDRIEKAKKNNSDTLVLSNCGLKELPIELFELTQLKKLVIGNNPVNWENEVLDETPFDEDEDEDEDEEFEFNSIQELPKEFTKLIKLEELYLGGDDYRNDNWKITDISILSRLHKLKKLDLGSNIIEDISPLQLLSQLEYLNLTANNINDISALSQLTSLKWLSLASNNVKNVNPLQNLLNLSYLNLFKNNLEDISSLSKLSNLEWLRASSNKIVKIGLIKNFKKLKTLDLNDNDIVDIQHVSNLKNLQIVNFSSNKLIDISSLSNLFNLTTIILDSNRIINIEPLLKYIEKGFSLNKFYSRNNNKINVDNNPLVHPPQAIIKQGTNEVLTYFNDLKQQGTKTFNEAKLIIVGEPYAGKSTLLKKLIDPNYIPTDISESTLGVDVYEGWQFDHPKKNNSKFNANIWDFGGQQIQYMTHQFFLTPDAVYILVHSNDRDEPSNFPYWFKIIHLLGETEERYSPVLVVLNEKNKEFISKFDSEFYSGRYPELQIETCSVDLNHNDSRYKNLRTKVQTMLTELPHVNDERPAKWDAIRTALKEKSKTHNYIDFLQYSEICSSFGVTDESSQKILSGYLHRLGGILHFLNDLSLINFIILKPQWAVDAVYSVLSNTDISKADGYFNQEKLDVIWKKYSIAERGNLLNLMKQENFEICYELGNKKGTFIAAQLLNEKRPFYEWDDQNNLRFRFRYKYMPEGIITRLIVRINHLIAKHENIDLVWQKGIVIEEDSCRAQIKEEENNEGLKVIDITVSGERTKQKYLLRKIRSEILNIHDKWFKNINFEQMIPCTCSFCSSSNPVSQKYFEYSVLERAQNRGKNTIECDIEFIEVSVLELLEGVFDASEMPDKINKQGGYERYSEVHIHNHVDVSTLLQNEQKKASLEPTNNFDEQLPWYKEWWFISLSVSVGSGLLTLVNFNYSVALLVSVFIFIIMLAFNPKRRFFRVALSSLSLGILQFPSISGKFTITENDFFNGYISFGSTTIPWLGILLIITSLFLFWLDYKTEQSKHN